MASLTYSVIILVSGKLDAIIKERENLETPLDHFIENFEWLSKNLTIIRDYVKVADEQSKHKASVKSWLLDVAEIAWDVEDILEEFAIQSKPTNDESSRSSCVRAFSFSKLALRYKMTGRIKDVKGRIRSILEDLAELKLVGDLTHSDQPCTSTSQNVNLRRLPRIESSQSSHPVAIESKVEDLLRLLDDPAAPVIAVVGMGGVGKTFLVKNIFHRIKGKYENSIWLVISQTYSLKNLQATLAMELKLYEVVNERVSEVKAAELIHARLESTKSLIVLDDVWRATMQDDLISALGLPTGDNTHCKIVLTTRNKHVCRNMNARVYELHPLSEEESWALFCAFAFPRQVGNQPPRHLEGIARQVESKCGRLPLAVQTVAASLASEMLSRQWTSELEQLRVVSHTEDPVMRILLLSYISLPVYLKPCFAFLAFFQKDVKIDPQYLINLWIAEELIPEPADQQDTGWSYISQLEDLCLVEMRDDIHVPQKRCLKLHNLLLELAIGISKQSKCAFSVEEASMKSPAEQTKGRYRNYRRILLAGTGINDRTIAESSVVSPGSVKTLSIYDNDISTIPEQFFASMELLRILDLSSTHISTLPESVANLRHLRLLNLGRTKIRQVPKCIRKLANLRSLYISECTELNRLPVWIGELKYLEHLKVAGCSDELASHMPAGISMLFSLQTLTSDYLNLSIQDNKLLKLEHVVSLTRLEELCINVNHIEELEAIYEGVLEQLVKLRSLAIANEIPPMEFKNAADLPSSLPDSMKAMENIEKLFLWNFSVPSWVCGFQKLRVIEICGDCSSYPELDTILSLETLSLLHNRICTALPRTFRLSSGFPNLRLLEISDFPLLEEIPELEEGAMPRLEKVWIYSCEKVKKIPDHLKRLNVHKGSNEIIESSQKDSSALREGFAANSPVSEIVEED